MIMRNTKQILIECGAQAMLEKGYHGVGLNEILSAAGVPKGSFYYYFKSKEDLGVAIIAYYASQTAEAMELILGDQSTAPYTRLRTFFQAACNKYEKDACRHGCLLCKLGTELACAGDAMREALQKGIRRRVHLLAKCIEAAQQAGEISSGCSAATLASFIYNAWSGAVVSMQIEQDAEHLHSCIDFIFTRIITQHDTPAA
jgi:TetR/AcrR family transcriptional repressor of nem operon